MAATPPGDAVADVASDTQVRKEMILLVDKAQTPPLRRQSSHVIIMHEYPPCQQAGVAGHRFQQGCLARTGGPDDQRIPTGGDFEGDVPEIEATHSDMQLVQPNHLRSSGCSTRTTMKTVSATRRRITAAGTAACRPKAVNRSKM